MGDTVWNEESEGSNEAIIQQSQKIKGLKKQNENHANKYLSISK